MMALASHLQNLEAEKQKYKAQVRRLCQENAWIRDELNTTQHLLRQSEQVIDYWENFIFLGGGSIRRRKQTFGLFKFN